VDHELEAGSACSLSRLNAALSAPMVPVKDHARAESEHADHTHVDLQRVTSMPGYSTVVFRGRHVPDPTELDPVETVAFWSAVAVAARAIEAVFRPCHLNFQILGNSMPHVHVHIVPRYLTDSAPERPLGDGTLRSASRLPAQVLGEQVAALISATQG
jgi:diadenosine tetraphosphate (Ap4A) HIT family hydrolase